MPWRLLTHISPVHVDQSCAAKEGQMKLPHESQVNLVEFASGLLLIAIETLKRSERLDCIEVAHRMDLAALREADKHLQNAFLRLADSARQIGISKDPEALKRSKTNRKNSRLR
jgi:hypothetical protein